MRLGPFQFSTNAQLKPNAYFWLSSRKHIQSIILSPPRYRPYVKTLSPRQLVIGVPFTIKSSFFHPTHQSIQSHPTQNNIMKWYRKKNTRRKSSAKPGMKHARPFRALSNPSLESHWTFRMMHTTAKKKETKKKNTKNTITPANSCARLKTMRTNRIYLQ